MKNNLIYSAVSKLSIFRLENSLKNILIFFPLLFSGRGFVLDEIIQLFFGFLIFTFITSICYVTNDYTDRKIDKKNKLKLKNIAVKKETVVLLNIILFIFILTLSQVTNFVNIYLLLYLLLFFLYNYFLKFVFLLDIICLVSFYIVRIFYGSLLVDMFLSYWFLMFFISIFIILAIFKRMIQITTNKLNKTNENK